MLQTAISNATKLGDGTWRAPVSPADVDRLGRPLGREPGPSILYVSAVTEVPDRTIIFPLSDAAVLNRGTLADALIVARVPNHHTGSIHYGEENGDESFVEEAAAAGEAVGEFAECMLEAIREVDPNGRLFAFPGRRFINKPDNFITLVPQPRVQELKVIVRGQPGDFRDAPEDLKSDQNGYSTFKIKSSTDLAPAIALLKQIRRKR